MRSDWNSAFQKPKYIEESVVTSCFLQRLYEGFAFIGVASFSNLGIVELSKCVAEKSSDVCHVYFENQQALRRRL